MWRYIKDHLETVLIAIILAFGVRQFILTVYKMPSPTMYPAVEPGDFLFTYKIPYGLEVPFLDRKIGRNKKPSRGEVVVVRSPDSKDSLFLKRIIAVEGDRVELRDGAVILNSESIDGGADRGSLFGPIRSEVPQEHGGYSVVMPKGSSLDNLEEMIVPKGHVFILSDNRTIYEDSRDWGPIPLDWISGRATIVWFSLDWERKQFGLPAVRWEGLFKPIH